MISDKLETFRTRKDSGWEDVQGYACQIKGFEEWKFFLYQGSYNDCISWFVVEVSSGFACCRKFHEDKFSAYRDAELRMGVCGKSRFGELVQTAIDHPNNYRPIEL